MVGAKGSFECCRPAKVYGASTNGKIGKLCRVLLSIGLLGAMKTQMRIEARHEITDSYGVER